MAVEIRAFTISVPKGGTATAPQKFPLTMPVRELDGVEIYVPAGANGQLNFALGAAGTPTIPTNPGAYLIANDEVMHWPLEHQIDSGAWQLFAYNTGSVAHLIHIRFLLTPPGMDKPPVGAGWIDALTIEFPGSGGSSGGGGGGGGGASYSFAIERPLAVLSAQAGGAGTSTLLLDEVGPRPGPYNVSFSGVASGITLTAVAGSSPTALTLAATVAGSVAPQSYTATVTVTNGGITNSATLTIKVTAPVGGGGGGGGGGGTATLSASPNPVAAGQPIIAVGTAFAANEAVTLFLSSYSWSATASAAGSFAVSLLIPTALTPGAYTLSCAGAQHSVTGPTLTVTAPPAPTLVAGGLSITAGDRLVFSGAGWGPNTAVTVTFAGMSATIYADSGGSFNNAWNTPVMLAAGTYSMLATAGSNTATVAGIVVSAYKGSPSSPIIIPVDGGSHTVPAGSYCEFDISGPRGDVLTLVTPSGNVAVSSGDSTPGNYKLPAGPGVMNPVNAGVWQVLGTYMHPNSFSKSVTVVIT